MSQFKVSVGGAGCSDIAVPNTGFITNTSNHHSNGGEIMGIGLFVIVMALFGILTAFVLKKRKTHRILMNNNGFNLSFCRKSVIRVFALVFVILATSFVTFDQIQNQEEKSYATSGYNEESLTISTDDVNLVVNVNEGEENAFGYVASKVKVNESTLFGYRLAAYVTDNNLKSKQGDEIKSIDSKTPTVLSENTWGIAKEKPSDQDAGVWYGLPTTLGEALILKDTEYATSENDETTVYYGTKIDNKLSCGDYEGVTINYVAVANVVPPEVTFEFQGEETYFDNGKKVTSNRVGYADTCVKSKGYIGSDYEVLKTENMDENGNWDGNSIDLVGDTVSIPGADRLVLEVTYHLHDSVEMYIFDENDKTLYGKMPVIDLVEEGDGVARYVIDSDSMMVFTRREGTLAGGDEDTGGRISPSYRYGYYIKVYPVYNNARAGTSYEELPEVCGWTKVMGGYKDPIDRDGMELNGWVSGYIDTIGQNIDFSSGGLFDAVKAGKVDADEMIRYLLTAGNFGEALKGQTIVFDADWKPYYEIVYEGNGGKALVCKVDNDDLDPGFVKESTRETKAETIRCPESEIEERTSLSQRIPYNDNENHYIGEYQENIVKGFYRQGYSLIGWSTSPNATVPEHGLYEQIVVPDESGERRLILYAIWGEVEYFESAL